MFQVAGTTRARVHQLARELARPVAQQLGPVDTQASSSALLPLRPPVRLSLHHHPRAAVPDQVAPGERAPAVRPEACRARQAGHCLQQW